MKITFYRCKYSLIYNTIYGKIISNNYKSVIFIYGFVFLPKGCFFEVKFIE